MIIFIVIVYYILIHANTTYFNINCYVMMVRSLLGWAFLFHFFFKFPGEMGRPYFVNRSQLTSEEKAEYDTGWKNNDFNEFVSNRIPLQRSLPDPRDAE